MILVMTFDMPFQYPNRDAQEQSMARAHAWLERLMDLAQYETMVLRRSGDQGQHPIRAVRDREQPLSTTTGE